MSEISIEKNLAKVLESIEQSCLECGRNPEDVQLIAVSKTKPHEAITEAFSAGQIHFGENRMQELQEKMSVLDLPNAQWHMIGTIQSNKIKYIAEKVDWIHSVSKAKYLTEINRRAAEHNRTINVLIQVNISGEDQKSGCEVSELGGILNHAKTLPHIMVRGLMGIASFVEDPEDVRSEFRLLRETLDQFSSSNGGNVQLTELSMGMSGDMKVAIQEGATMVRVGSAIFGSRNYA